MDVLVHSFADALEQLVLCLRSEWVVALHHYVVQDPQGPHVREYWDVVSLAHDLRRHVSGRPAERVYCFWGFCYIKGEFTD